MKLDTADNTLTVSHLAELTAAQAAVLRDSVKTALIPAHQCSDILDISDPK